MNKRQLIIAWIMGVILSIWSLMAFLIIFKGRNNLEFLVGKIPGLIKSNVTFVLPILIIGSFLVYILRDEDQ